MAEKKLKINSEFIELKAREKGWNLFELAARCGIVYNTLVKYFKSEEVRLSVVNKMAEVLEVDPEKLLLVKVGE